MVSDTRCSIGETLVPHSSSSQGMVEMAFERLQVFSFLFLVLDAKGGEGGWMDVEKMDGWMLKRWMLRRWM